jgi:uncharacterized membrane-anchored protein YitT (DUF2179 family)
MRSYSFISFSILSSWLAKQAPWHLGKALTIIDGIVPFPFHFSVSVEQNHQVP